MAPGRTTKRRRVSPPGDDENASSRPSGAPIGDFYSHAAEWDLEQDYERRPRKSSKKDKERTRLPIKTAEGFQTMEEPEIEAEESDSFLGTDDDEDEGMDDTGADEDEDDEEEVKEEAPKIPLKVQIIQAKEEIARLATLINEDPEEHIPLFKTMAEMVDPSKHVAIQKLALASQAAVYKDVIPGYRIRPLTDQDMTGKISKEVRKLRSYEQSLLSNYKHYIGKLVEITKPQKRDAAPVDAGLKTIAINCACNLLLSVPHFNFRTELLKILINRLARRQVDADFVKCRETLEDVFQKDEDGVVSLEAVRLLSKLMKAKEFRVHESVLDTFLSLRLLSEFAHKASRDRIEREPEEDNFGGKKPKQKREFRTKKERKVQKERKAVEKDMKEADALVSHEERDKNQAETLKLVFGVYFRILKLRIPTLMGPVLEGLAKYAHLINQDFFGDLLEALKELIAHADRDEEENHAEEAEDEDHSNAQTSTRDAHREALLCTVTAFALLEGQDASKAAANLHLDLSYFVRHLYRSLYTLSINPDVEYNPDKSLRLPDPDSHAARQSAPRSRKKVNFQTPTVLLLRCLHSTLISRAHGNPPPVRLGGFAKRLMTSSLQLPEKSAIATLALMNQVARHNARRIASLWHSEERRGDGVFNPFAADIETTNVFAGTVWEGELLRNHYCPQIRDAALDIEKMIVTRN
ncbi:nuclear export protein Noc3 [Aspergillus japonicus CBS 114.51]|uniref:Nucleolar complex-associated protein 3 n=2 Tax=Aspergillus TaxID=5052 RepID=A0A2V5HLL2_ASPV1|nr:nuclear export protein Noc3 [Aspergillus japonicus CBS 114.51]PYI12837.1 nuclear export protein Noc3 [Aspergillus violaceofuscus CBS 115571]RAH76276.1 nuclear export protein Noc3 [Aspergillus japonicus CBS 114.51]